MVGPPEVITEEEIKERAYAPSFDVNRMFKQVNIRSQWQALLRAHLYLDHIVTEMLEDDMPKKGHVKSSQITFHHRLELACALGLMPEPAVPMLRKINSLRNDLAHKLDFSVSRKNFIDLRNCVPKPTKEYAVEQFCIRRGFTAEKLSFPQLLASIVFSVEAYRQVNMRERLEALRARQDLNAAIWEVHTRIPNLLEEHRGREDHLRRESQEKAAAALARQMARPLFPKGPPED